MKYGNDQMWFMQLIKNNPDMKIIKIPLPLYHVRYYSSNYRIISHNKFQAIKARIHNKRRLKYLKKELDDFRNTNTI